MLQTAVYHNQIISFRFVVLTLAGMEYMKYKMYQTQDMHSRYASSHKYNNNNDI